VDVICLDFQKAIDKVLSSRIVKKKVQALGTNGMVYTRIADWSKKQTSKGTVWWQQL
jgi:hypothetical protein